jgi:chromate reductase, NAD(P)H dehydrogenase (quinone)
MSSNGMIIDHAKKYYSQHIWMDLELNKMPFFDPDLQYSNNLPEVVSLARKQASDCDLIFVSSPEYAHGIPGILKNALEWLFHEGTQKKPVAVVVASSQGEYAMDQLVEVLKTMDFSVSAEKTYLLKTPRSKFSKNGQWIDLEEEKRFNNFCNDVFKEVSSQNN